MKSESESESESTPEVEIQEETSIGEDTQRNYRIWKKNSPFLYDYLSTNSLLWPSLSIQFFPDHASNKSLGNNSSKDNEVYYQRLLLGTFTLGQSVDSISVLQLPQYKDLNKNLNINKLDYNQDKQEFELKMSSNNKLKVVQKINHFGDVNKTIYMPQNPNIIAASNNFGNISIYERTKHKSFKNSIIDDTELNKVQIHLSNPEISSCSENNGIFAIDWSKQIEGTIISGDMNGRINLYDIRNNYSCKDDNVFAHWSYQVLNQGDIGINDIKWFPNHNSIFGTVQEDGFIRIFDTRLQSLNSNTLSFKDSTIGVNSLNVNPGNNMVIATGNSRGQINIWDIRNFKNNNHNQNQINSSLIQINNQHTDSITQVKWHPKYHNILGSSSTDGSVRLFDISNSNINSNQGLIFLHAGHMLGVNDFDWSYHDDWLIASVADDNSLHIWKPTHLITNKYHN
ncbi:chromatin assembly complex, subunit 3 [Scheffersomyces amazonensis]|uniref:chromatin assembly complex, subunit 3 n=1 Tax=Scheffersomyces amazonensis TaxID=1078765 RepID=UPI00315DFDB3